MHWILMVWLAASYTDSRSGVTMDHVEFQSEAQCHAAFAQMKQLNNGEMYLRGVCVEDK